MTEAQTFMAQLQRENARLREELAKVVAVNSEQAEQIRRAQERIRASEAERDRLVAAIEAKGGSEHAPTEFAYIQACAAIERQRERAEKAEAERDSAWNAAIEAAVSAAEELEREWCGDTEWSSGVLDGLGYATTAIRALTKEAGQ